MGNTCDSWQPKCLKQLVDQIASLSERFLNKSAVPFCELGSKEYPTPFVDVDDSVSLKASISKERF